MQPKQVGTLLVASLMVLGLTGSAALAQNEPWDLFLDAASTSACDVVNAENVELVVLHDTGELVMVTGPDVILADSFVDEDGTVFFGADPMGFIDFAEDGDGFRTLWWLSLTGLVVHVDGFTGEPSETNVTPTDFFDVPCDACPLWDDPTVCALPDDPGDPDDIFPPLFSINFCGMGTSMAMAMTVLGLLSMGLMRRRWPLG